ncbi:uncharacterized protein [Rutidosis leptorrhynchoides]|uniref:uncharacterized protein n=1 Tax=Rutidosis leptorrhynchoides TaxID=125765 RepID=UPI003A9A488D
MEESATSVPQSFLSSIQSWFTPTILFIFLNLMIATIFFSSNLPNQNKQTQQQDQDQNKKPQNQNESKLTRSPSILHLLRSYNLYPQTSLQQLPPQEQEPLEPATQFVFNHSFTHEQHPKPISPNTKSSNLDSTRPYLNHTITNEAKLTNENLKPNRPDLNQTNEVPVSEPVVKAHTHLVYDNNHTIEKMTAHFHHDPTHMENENHPDPEETDEFDSLDEIYRKITGGHVNRTKSDTLPASGELPVKLPMKMKKSASMKSAFSHFEEDNIVEARRPTTVRERRSAAKATEDDDVEVDAKADDFINKFKHQLKLQKLDSISRYKDMVNRRSEGEIY